MADKVKDAYHVQLEPLLFHGPNSFDMKYSRILIVMNKLPD